MPIARCLINRPRRRTRRGAFLANPSYLLPSLLHSPFGSTSNELREDQRIRRRESFLSCLHSKTHCPRESGRRLSDGHRTWNRSAFDAGRGGRPHSGKGFKDMHAVTPFSLHQVCSACVLVCVDVSKVRIPCCGAVPALAGWLCWSSGCKEPRMASSTSRVGWSAKQLAKMGMGSLAVRRRADGRE